MAGIEILQSIETNIYAWGWDQFHCISIGVFLGGAFSIYWLFKNYCGDDVVEEVLVGICALSMVVALLSIFPLGIDKGGLAHSYTTHQVLIDESANPVELLDKYDIIKQEGKTYWIREKGWDNY